MKRGSLSFIVFLGLLFFCPDFSPAQAVDNAANTDDEVIELGTAEIKVKIETPQIKLFSSRIKPEFDDVHLEKSFLREITGLGETFEIKQMNTDISKRINIDKILKKLR